MNHPVTPLPTVAQFDATSRGRLPPSGRDAVTARLARSAAGSQAWTTAGRRVVADIIASGHTCTIFSAPASLTKDQNVCTKNPPTLASDIAAMPRPFRPRHKNLQMKDLVNANLVAKFKVQLENLGERHKKATVAPELALILAKARARYADPIRELSRKLGISTIDVYDMFMGEKAIDDKTYYTISFVFYDFLTPGPGCDTSIRFQPYGAFKRDFQGDFGELEVGKLETKRKVLGAVMFGSLSLP